MGLSSNQARFLSLTSRQVDLEHRIQQICQRRLRLSSELENVATSYNNSISNRKMFTASQTNQGINTLSIASLSKLGYKVIDSKSKNIVNNVGLMNKASAPSSTAMQINSEQDFENLISVINAGGAAATTALNGNYVLNNDIDLSDNATFSKAVINGIFTGTFDGQGHTISGASVYASSSDQSVGVFAQNNGSIKNLQISDMSITSAASSVLPLSNMIGILVGNNNGAIDNVAVTNSTIKVGDDFKGVGGLAGVSEGNISNSYAETDITTGSSVRYISGLVGDINPTSVISSCYSTGDVTVGDNSTNIGGFGSSPDVGNIIQNCYSTGNITTGANAGAVGGFVSNVNTGVVVSNSYTSGNIYVGTGSWDVGGFTGSNAGSVDGSNFYQNNMTTTAGGAVTTSSSAISLWNSSIWNLSGDLPSLIGTNDSTLSLEEGLRNGTYSLAREADEFTQDPIDLNGEKYQEVDWRSTPSIYDELNKGDDVAAENKYDKTVEEINAQDKKLQLEQTTIEVEYKAVASEKEAVKKILDTNATASFKYFS